MNVSSVSIVLSAKNSTSRKKGLDDFFGAFAFSVSVATDKEK